MIVVNADSDTTGPTTDAIAAIRRAFGDPRPLSADAVWQKPFDYDSAHLHRLAVLPPDADAEPADLVAYALDFKYEQIQKDLFMHVLPFCLRAWREDLTSPFGRYETFVDEFYPALLRGSVFKSVLAPQEAEAVGDFMRGAILAQIDAQAGAVVQGIEVARLRLVPRAVDLRPVAPRHPDAVVGVVGRRDGRRARWRPRSTRRASSTTRRRTRCSTRGRASTAAGRPVCGTTAATSSRNAGTPRTSRCSRAC